MPIDFRSNTVQRVPDGSTPNTDFLNNQNYKVPEDYTPVTTGELIDQMQEGERLPDGSISKLTPELLPEKESQTQISSITKEVDTSVAKNAPVVTPASRTNIQTSTMQGGLVHKNLPPILGMLFNKDKTNIVKKIRDFIRNSLQQNPGVSFEEIWNNLVKANPQLKEQLNSYRIVAERYYRHISGKVGTGQPDRKLSNILDSLKAEIEKLEPDEVDKWLNDLVARTPYLAQYKDLIRKYISNVRQEKTDSGKTDSPGVVRTYLYDKDGFPYYEENEQQFFALEKIVQDSQLVKQFLAKYPQSAELIEKYRKQLSAQEKLKSYIDEKTGEINWTAAYQNLDRQVLLDAGVTPEVLEQIGSQLKEYERLVNLPPRGYPPGVTQSDYDNLNARIAQIQTAMETVANETAELRKRKEELYQIIKAASPDGWTSTDNEHTKEYHEIDEKLIKLEYQYKMLFDSSNALVSNKNYLDAYNTKYGIYDFENVQFKVEDFQTMLLSTNPDIAKFLITDSDSWYLDKDGKRTYRTNFDVYKAIKEDALDEQTLTRVLGLTNSDVDKIKMQVSLEEFTTKDEDGNIIPQIMEAKNAGYTDQQLKDAWGITDEIIYSAYAASILQERGIITDGEIDLHKLAASVDEGLPESVVWAILGKDNRDWMLAKDYADELKKSSPALYEILKSQGTEGLNKYLADNYVKVLVGGDTYTFIPKEDYAKIIADPDAAAALAVGFGEYQNYARKKFLEEVKKNSPSLYAIYLNNNNFDDLVLQYGVESEEEKKKYLESVKEKYPDLYAQYQKDKNFDSLISNYNEKVNLEIASFVEELKNNHVLFGLYNREGMEGLRKDHDMFLGEIANYAVNKTTEDGQTLLTYDVTNFVYDNIANPWVLYRAMQYIDNGDSKNGLVAQGMAFYEKNIRLSTGEFLDRDYYYYKLTTEAQTVAREHGIESLAHYLKTGEVKEFTVKVNEYGQPQIQTIQGIETSSIGTNLFFSPVPEVNNKLVEEELAKLNKILEPFATIVQPIEQRKSGMQYELEPDNYKQYNVLDAVYANLQDGTTLALMSKYFGVDNIQQAKTYAAEHFKLANGEYINSKLYNSLPNEAKLIANEKGLESLSYYLSTGVDLKNSPAKMEEYLAGFGEAVLSNWQNLSAAEQAKVAKDFEVHKDIKKTLADARLSLTKWAGSEQMDSIAKLEERVKLGGNFVQGGRMESAYILEAMVKAGFLDRNNLPLVLATDSTRNKIIQDAWSNLSQDDKAKVLANYQTVSGKIDEAAAWVEQGMNSWKEYAKKLPTAERFLLSAGTGLAQMASGMVVGLGGTAIKTISGVQEGNIKSAASNIAMLPLGMGQWALVDTPENIKADWVSGVGMLVGNLALPLVAKVVKGAVWDTPISMVEMTRAYTKASVRPYDFATIIKPKAFTQLRAEVRQAIQLTEWAKTLYKEGKIGLNPEGKLEIKSASIDAKTLKVAERALDFNKKLQDAIAKQDWNAYNNALAEVLPMKSQIALNFLNKIMQKWDSFKGTAQSIPVEEVFGSKNPAASANFASSLATLSNNYGITITGATARYMQGSGTSVAVPTVIGIALRGASATLANAKTVAQTLVNTLKAEWGSKNVRHIVDGNTVVIQVKDGILWSDKAQIILEPNKQVSSFKIDNISVDSLDIVMVEAARGILGIDAQDMSKLNLEDNKGEQYTKVLSESLKIAEEIAAQTENWALQEQLTAVSLEYQNSLAAEEAAANAGKVVKSNQHNSMFRDIAETLIDLSGKANKGSPVAPIRAFSVTGQLSYLKVPEEFTKLQIELDNLFADPAFFEEWLKMPGDKQLELVRQSLNPQSLVIFDNLYNLGKFIHKTEFPAPSSVDYYNLEALQKLQPAQRRAVADAIKLYAQKNSSDIAQRGSVIEMWHGGDTAADLDWEFTNSKIIGIHVTELTEILNKIQPGFVKAEGAKIILQDEFATGGENKLMEGHSTDAFKNYNYGLEGTADIIADGVRMSSFGRQFLTRIGNSAMLPATGVNVGKLLVKHPGRRKDILRLKEDLQIAEKLLKNNKELTELKTALIKVLPERWDKPASVQAKTWEELGIIEEGSPEAASTLVAGENLEIKDAPPEMKDLAKSKEFAQWQQDLIEVSKFSGGKKVVAHRPGFGTITVIPTEASKIMSGTGYHVTTLESLAKNGWLEQTNTTGKVKIKGNFFTSSELAELFMIAKLKYMPKNLATVAIRMTPKDIGTTHKPSWRSETIMVDGKMQTIVFDEGIIYETEILATELVEGNLSKHALPYKTGQTQYRSEFGHEVRPMLWYTTELAKQEGMAAPDKTKMQAISMLGILAHFADILHPTMPKFVIKNSPEVAAIQFRLRDIFQRQHLIYKGEPGELRGLINDMASEIPKLAQYIMENKMLPMTEELYLPTTEELQIVMNNLTKTLGLKNTPEAARMSTLTQKISGLGGYFSPSENKIATTLDFTRLTKESIYTNVHELMHANAENLRSEPEWVSNKTEEFAKFIETKVNGLTEAQLEQLFNKRSKEIGREKFDVYVKNEIKGGWSKEEIIKNIKHLIISDRKSQLAYAIEELANTIMTMKALKGEAGSAGKTYWDAWNKNLEVTVGETQAKEITDMLHKWLDPIELPKSFKVDELFKITRSNVLKDMQSKVEQRIIFLADKDKVANWVATGARAKSASMPVFVTKANYQQLLDLKFPREVINTLTPEEVLAAIKEDKLFDPEKNVPASVKKQAEAIMEEVLDKNRINNATEQAARILEDSINKTIEANAPKEYKAYTDAIKSGRPEVVINLKKIAEAQTRMLLAASMTPRSAPASMKNELQSTFASRMPATKEQVTSVTSSFPKETKTSSPTSLMDYKIASDNTTLINTSPIFASLSDYETTEVTTPTTSTYEPVETASYKTATTKLGKTTIKIEEPVIEPVLPATPTPVTKTITAPLKLGKGKDKKSKEFPESPPITWRQGLFWITISPPYRNRANVKYTRVPPAGAVEIKGIESAYKTIQTLGGNLNMPELKIDMGIQDVVIQHPSSNPGKMGAIKFRKDKRMETKGNITIGNEQPSMNPAPYTSMPITLPSVPAAIPMPPVQPAQPPTRQPIVINEDNLHVVRKAVKKGKKNQQQFTGTRQAGEKGIKATKVEGMGVAPYFNDWM